MHDAEWLRTVLLLSQWKFGRADGSTIAHAVGFEYGGLIKGTTHANERAWRIQDGLLEFLNEERRPTTRFDVLTRSSDGRIVLSGTYLLDRSANIGHILEQSTCAAAPPQGLKAAVLVRTHVVNEKLLDLVAILQSGFGYDLYIAADVTKGEFPLRGPNILPHSTNMCRDLNLSVNHERPLWWFGDYALYCSYEQIPGYDFYCLIEFDVHLMRQNSLFLEGLISRASASIDKPIFDYVAPGMNLVKNKESWAGPLPEGFLHWWSYLNFVLISRQALSYLYSERKKFARSATPELERWYCEHFVPTVLHAERRFKCKSLSVVFPGSYRDSSFSGSRLPHLLGSRF